MDFENLDLSVARLWCGVCFFVILDLFLLQVVSLAASVHRTRLFALAHLVFREVVVVLVLVLGLRSMALSGSFWVLRGGGSLVWFWILVVGAGS